MRNVLDALEAFICIMLYIFCDKDMDDGGQCRYVSS